MNTELEQRDSIVLKQVKEKVGNLLQQYIFDENDVYQLQAKKTIERVLQQNDATLDIYGILHETDKASLAIKEGKLLLPHDYLRHYERFLQDSARGKPRRRRARRPSRHGHVFLLVVPQRRRHGLPRAACAGRRA